jgi:hypothetical protein
MKKNVATSVLLALAGALALSGCAARATGPHPGFSTASGRNAAAGHDLIKLLPRSMIGVIVVDLKRLMEVDEVAKAVQDPKFKEGYDAFVAVTGIDPKEDVASVGMGVPATLLQMASGTSVSNIGIVFDIREGKAGRLQDLIRLTPGIRQETYSDVPVYSNLGNEEKTTTPDVPTKVGEPDFKIGFLDASLVVIGDDLGVKGVIDVYKKRTEALAKSPEMTALIGRADKSGIAWGAMSYPPGYLEKFAQSSPIKPVAGLEGVTLSLDDRNSTFVADLRTVGGTKEENATRASTLNGLKAIFAATEAAKEPLVAELLSGLAVSSGEDYIRLTMTVSHETLGKLLKLAEPKAGGGRGGRPGPPAS